MVLANNQSAFIHSNRKLKEQKVGEAKKRQKAHASRQHYCFCLFATISCKRVWGVWSLFRQPGAQLSTGAPVAKGELIRVKNQDSEREGRLGNSRCTALSMNITDVQKLEK